ncbi:MAG TPA: hypothetical protein VE344_00550 [Methylomirabilota bacterium]|nr:hypothetical protein [Methylomirabilota bacterium]
MKRRAVQFFFLFVLGAILLSAGGCASSEPENSSVRPWNTPQNWEGGLPLINDQHR